MRLIRIVIFLLTALIFVSASYAYNISAKNTLVAGFINKGDASGDNINAVITKSLITFLAKLPGVEITSYPDLEKIMQSNNFWGSKELNIDKALQTAQSLNAEHLITGDYKVDGKTKKLVVNLYAYDVITGKLKLKRSIQGAAGMDLFDVIDTIKKNISGLLFGTDFSFGILKIEINGSSGTYRLYSGGKYIADISGKNSFEDQFIAGEEMEISLRLAGSGKEVLRKAFVLNKNEKKNIVYRPSGSIIVKSLVNQSQVFLDNKLIGVINQDESLTIPDVPSGADHMVGLKKDNQIVQVKKINLPEGENEIVIIGAKKADVISYKNTFPLMNILIPGFAQYQAGDAWMGTLFLTLGAGGAGLTVFSEVAYGLSYSKYEKASGGIKALYLSDSQFWRALSITGICFWAGSALISTLHAYYQPSFGSVKKDNSDYWAFAFTDGGMELVIVRRF